MPGARDGLKIDAASRLEVVDVIQEVAESLAMAEGLDPEGAHFLGVAVREAVVNAIRHGSGLNPGRRVKVAFRKERRRALVITVRDQGPGFDPGRLPDPLSPENLRRGSGRGIFYMRQFVDRVSFLFPRGGGTLVRLEKRLPVERPG